MISNHMVMEEIKILFITCWYPHPGFPNRGIFVREHAKAIADQGGSVKVFHLWVEESSSLWEVEERQFIDDNIEVFSIVIHSRFQRYIYGNTPLMRFLGLHYFKSRISGFNPDIIHGNVVYQAGLIAEKIASFTSKPFVISEHWSKLDWYFGRKALSYQAQKVYNKAKAILPVSDFLGENILHHINQKGGEITVVPNVVDTDLFYHIEKETARYPVNLLLVMNYQNSQKKPELLLKALSQLPKKLQEKFRLTMVGRGNGKIEKKQYWDDLGIKSPVSFCGEVEKHKVAEAMRNADFFLQPTKVETFGITVAEALCSGLPCIVSKVGALPELVDQDSGVLLENDVKNWVKALQDILEENYDFDRKQIAAKYKNQFSYDRVGSQLMEVYEDTLEGVKHNDSAHS